MREANQHGVMPLAGGIIILFREHRLKKLIETAALI
jgi:hypothetical protein